MSKRDLYRQHAAACLRVADVATAIEARTALICMAQRWYELADREPLEEFLANRELLKEFPAGAKLLTGAGD